MAFAGFAFVDWCWRCYCGLIVFGWVQIGGRGGQGLEVIGSFNVIVMLVVTISFICFLSSYRNPFISL